ncbi:hypothetical protein NEMIN01_0849 [Nematocida minor]|uniref:uncharacterized protein n=1 Tax=Nematocida minor TaxID=1912983 RepID=UPI00221FE245|nr:uncharacterized protein NEMIN01_0849 [Nematocida minor]KAI5190064.1 hypothetical protein NEMIN01_0849 [Nematocida minor]
MPESPPTAKIEIIFDEKEILNAFKNMPDKYKVDEELPIDNYASFLAVKHIINGHVLIKADFLPEPIRQNILEIVRYLMYSTFLSTHILEIIYLHELMLRGKNYDAAIENLRKNITNYHIRRKKNGHETNSITLKHELTDFINSWYKIVCSVEKINVEEYIKLYKEMLASTHVFFLVYVKNTLSTSTNVISNYFEQLAFKKKNLYTIKELYGTTREGVPLVDYALQYIVDISETLQEPAKRLKEAYYAENKTNKEKADILEDILPSEDVKLMRSLVYFEENIKCEKNVLTKVHTVLENLLLSFPSQLKLQEIAPLEQIDKTPQNAFLNKVVNTVERFVESSENIKKAKKLIKKYYDEYYFMIVEQINSVSDEIESLDLEDIELEELHTKKTQELPTAKNPETAAIEEELQRIEEEKAVLNRKINKKNRRLEKLRNIRRLIEKYANRSSEVLGSLSKEYSALDITQKNYIASKISRHAGIFVENYRPAKPPSARKLMFLCSTLQQVFVSNVFLSLFLLVISFTIIYITLRPAAGFHFIRQVNLFK